MPPRRRYGKSGSPLKAVFSVHVSKLRLGTTKSQVYEVFKNYGNIVEIWFPTIGDDSTLTYTFAFVRYETLEAAEKAVYEMNGWPMQGYKLRVQMASETVGYLSTAEKDERNVKKFGLEFSWMQELASIIGESECKDLLMNISKGDVRQVPFICFEGSKSTLDVEALDAAAALHEKQKAKVKKKRPVSPEPKEVPEDENDTKIELHKPHVKEFDFSKLSVEERVKKHHVWAFVQPEYWENDRYAPSKIGKVDKGLTADQHSISGGDFHSMNGGLENSSAEHSIPSKDAGNYITAGVHTPSQVSSFGVTSHSVDQGTPNRALLPHRVSPGSNKVIVNQPVQVSPVSVVTPSSITGVAGKHQPVHVSPHGVSPHSGQYPSGNPPVSPHAVSPPGPGVNNVERGPGHAGRGHRINAGQNALGQFSADCPVNFSLEQYLKSAGRGISRLPQS